MNKKVIYRVYESYNGKAYPYAEVYSDGSVKSLHCEPVIAKGLEEIWATDAEFARRSTDWYRLTCSWYMNEKYNDAFITLCFVTGKHPPFNGCEIEYFGEGEPWRVFDDGSDW